jgi:hypothetical protein
MRSIEHLHPIAKPPVGFKPITVPVGLEEKANGQYMLDRFSRDQEKGGPNRQFKIVLTPNGALSFPWRMALDVFLPDHYPDYVSGSTPWPQLGLRRNLAAR